MQSSSARPSSTPAVLLGDDTMRRHASGSITGVVFWTVNGQNFPDDTWNDFVIVVLGWWTTAVVRLLDGTSVSETMDFMDGPYGVVCNRVGKSVECQFVERRTEMRLLASWSGGTRELGCAIFQAVKSILRACHERGWADADIQLLENRVNALRRLI